MSQSGKAQVYSIASQLGTTFLSANLFSSKSKTPSSGHLVLLHSAHEAGNFKLACSHFFGRVQESNGSAAGLKWH